MDDVKILKLFLEKIPSEYPEHMLCFFANQALHGLQQPFTSALLRALSCIEFACPGYAQEMLSRMASIKGAGESQYETLLEILSEIYVTSGAVERADHDEDVILFNHEPGLIKGKKQPEFEVRLANHWCAIEVKTPRLISYGNVRQQRKVQLNSRLFSGKILEESTLPRDNPVKDFLVSADAKFKSYENYRAGSIRILVIVWDDFCNEPIAALNSKASGLLTARSFFRTSDNKPVIYPHIDAIMIIRHQHQLTRATRCEPLGDGLRDVFTYHHDGFPPKVLIPCHGGREIPQAVMVALNAIPFSEELGAEYHAIDSVFWTPLDFSQD